MDDNSADTKAVYTNFMTANGTGFDVSMGHGFWHASTRQA